MASSNVIKAVRTAILLLALVIFLGNIMMWIIMPTDTYYTIWVPHLMAATNSTFFGIQGFFFHCMPYFFFCVFSWCLINLNLHRSNHDGFHISHSADCCFGMLLSAFGEEGKWCHKKVSSFLVHNFQESVLKKKTLWLYVSWNESSSKARSWRLMRRPMIVKGLGIVTLTEMALFTMFIALCAWYFGGYLHHWFEQVYQRSLSKHEKV